MLSINDLTKTFGDKTAVNGLSLDVRAGDIFGFIGHNGAGKTTTIKCLTGIMSFDSGEILIDGHSIKDEPVYCKSIMAYIPDNPDIYDFMTGIKYINFIADIYGVPKDVREKNIAYYSEKFGLTAELNSRVSGYSHGMKQKLVLISAFVHSPKLLVLDEPFVGLDPMASYNLKQMLKEHCDNGGAVFFSTHVLEVAEKLCTKIAIIKQGELVACGATEDVCKNESLEQFFLELNAHE
mgnify:CR=1 FL=1